MRLQSIVIVEEDDAPAVSKLSCPECRDDGRQSRLEIAGVADNVFAVSNTVTFVCAACGWSEAYEL